MKGSQLSVRRCVVMFMDIHEFSIVMNGLGKNRYGFLQQVYERLGDVIVEHHGEIIKYLGDGLLCIFAGGAEVAAVACALELRRAFADLVREKNISHDTELEIGIGSGEVAVGIFGHSSLQQKDVFGDEVMHSAVIGHHRGIAITENVYRRVQDSYTTRQLPELPVKWQDEPLRVWEIIE
jgi:adenylate cyclase